MKSKKIALMDKFGENFTEGDVFKHYGLGFLERGCEVFQLDPYTIDFDRKKGLIYPLYNSNENFRRSKIAYSSNLESYDVIMDLSDVVDLDFAKRLNKINTFHLNPPIPTYNSADKRTYIKNYSEFIPKTIVSSKIDELEEILGFFGGEMIVKDPFGSCGRGVEKINKLDSNYKKILINLTKGEKSPIIAQKSMHFAHEGSKRVAVLGDIKNPKSYKIIHFFRRKPTKGNWRDNLSQGGEVIDVDFLREDEIELCLNVAKRSGLYAVGLDIMDDLDEKGKRVSRLVETNSVLTFYGRGRYAHKLKILPNFVLDNLLD